MNQEIEGVIKFNFQQMEGCIASSFPLAEFNRQRALLYQSHLVGMDGLGVGFGNISIRWKNTEPKEVSLSENALVDVLGEDAASFVISASQTGGKPVLDADDLVLISAVNIQQNHIRCLGKGKPSSESLTHAMFYALDPTINAVVHVHHQQLWQSLLFREPTTNKEIVYGTPAMALEIKRLFLYGELQQRQLLVMAGHEQGLISFGEDLESAVGIMLKKVHALD